MTTAPLIDKLAKIEGFYGRQLDLLRLDDQEVGSHNATEHPVYLAGATSAADHPNIGSIYFCRDLADEVFWEAECVGQCSLVALHDLHCNVLPICGCNVAVGKLCNVAQRLQSYKVDSQYSYGWISSSYVNAGRGIADLCCEVPQ